MAVIIDMISIVLCVHALEISFQWYTEKKALKKYEICGGKKHT